MSCLGASGLCASASFRPASVVSCDSCTWWGSCERQANSVLIPAQPRTSCASFKLYAAHEIQAKIFAKQDFESCKIARKSSSGTKQTLLPWSVHYGKEGEISQAKSFWSVLHTAVDEIHRQAGAEVNPGIFYMKQTISNACGTIGVLHAIGNNQHRGNFSKN